MPAGFRIFFGLFLVACVAVPWLCVSGPRQAIGPLVIAGFAALALAFMFHAKLRGVAFTVWVFAFVAAAMFYPAGFATWFGFDLARLIVPLIQIIMFGMGTTLSLRDFTRVLTMPWPVLVGMILQFTVMPLVGLAIATVFKFPPEIAAGVILIGSVPGGVASNLMTYLARGDVALSVTMTACSTLVSPLMTPLLMKLLAGRLVPIDFWELMFGILNMIIVPIVAGLIAHKILFSSARWAGQARPLALIAALTSLAALAAWLVPADALRTGMSEGRSAAALTDPGGSLTDLLLTAVISSRGGFVIGSLLIAAVSAVKLATSVWMQWRGNWMDRALPIVSMAGICLIIAIITARSREELLAVGAALILAAILHNTTGYVLGYWSARLLGLGETACRTVAIEVGLQNGGMASGLAIHVLKSPSAALAPAIFGPWMNVSGSVLATWWHRRPVKEDR